MKLAYFKKIQIVTETYKRSRCWMHGPRKGVHRQHALA
jgi:hypothetical protein